MGSEECTYMLLKNEADPNLYGHKPLYHFTPLHLAKTKKMAEILLDFQADPFLVSDNMLGSDNKKVKPTTVFRSLLAKQPEAALELLNDGVKTNGETLDSEKLLVILDYGQFLHEALHPSDDEQHYSTPLNRKFSFSGSGGSCEELAIPKVLLESGCRSKITNPILESFLELKWQLTRPFYCCHIFLYFIFLLNS